MAGVRLSASSLLAFRFRTPYRGSYTVAIESVSWCSIGGGRRTLLRLSNRRDTTSPLFTFLRTWVLLYTNKEISLFACVYRLRDWYRTFSYVAPGYNLRHLPNPLEVLTKPTGQPERWRAIKNPKMDNAGKSSKQSN